jgi:hypothetical protein
VFFPCAAPPLTIRTAIETKLAKNKNSEYEFRLSKAKKEAERQRIDEGKAVANKIFYESLTDKILRKGISYFCDFAKSTNSKRIVIVLGSLKRQLY